MSIGMDVKRRSYHMGVRADARQVDAVVIDMILTAAIAEVRALSFGVPVTQAHRRGPYPPRDRNSARPVRIPRIR